MRAPTSELVEAAKRFCWELGHSFTGRPLRCVEQGCTNSLARDETQPAVGPVEEQP